MTSTSFSGRDLIKAALRPASYRGQLREVMGTATTCALYPLGLADLLLSQVLDRLEPPATPVDRNLYTPVVLVHGWGANASAWIFMHRDLRRCGFLTVRSFSYRPLVDDIPTLAGQLTAKVHEVVAATGADKVHLVGHSMGGIIMRYAVTYLGLDRLVDTAITVASPHHGAPSAGVCARLLGPTGMLPGVCQMASGSELLTRLDADARTTTVRWIAFYGNLDSIVPARSAMLTNPADHATNILVRDEGHVSMVLSAQVVGSILTQLRAAEPRREVTPDRP